MSFFKGSAGDSVRKHGVEKTRRAAMPIWNYHRYFEGYVERDIVDEKGRLKTERIYAADYYVPSVDRNVWLVYKVMYLALMAITAVLFLHAATRRIVANAFWYVALTQALFLGLAAWLLTVVLSYMLAHPRMTIHTYRTTSVRLQKLAVGSGLLAGVLALENLAIGLRYEVDSANSLLSAGQYALCAAALWCMWRLESRLKYDRVPSGYQKQADDVEL